MCLDCKVFTNSTGSGIVLSSFIKNQGQGFVDCVHCLISSACVYHIYLSICVVS